MKPEDASPSARRSESLDTDCRKFYSTDYGKAFGVLKGNYSLAAIPKKARNRILLSTAKLINFNAQIMAKHLEGSREEWHGCQS